MPYPFTWLREKEGVLQVGPETYGQRNPASQFRCTGGLSRHWGILGAQTILNSMFLLILWEFSMPCHYHSQKVTLG